MGSDAVHEELSRLLAEVLRSGDQPIEVARRSRSDAAMVITDLDQLCRALDEAGCAPRVVGPATAAIDGPNGVDHEIVLGRCCYEAAATVAPSPVCGLHRGLLERCLHGSAMTVTGLEPGDPCRAGCRVHLRMPERATPITENA